ncbi:hypothetical protein PCC7418_1370 [Halothece sp. PCC 7418]|uniref:DUF4332 domain-containing protein n=1 Tax=Halothece sp. (strain PCC 7418) TaxID=65093 RepID=UPI0002A06F70|nr:DUF4332 domain-containing protein [Halothece sp. PCC 7418]AFZ43568.1 hypothetical protein PCC7418_1370 [Halothece sp. PCC 7418]
MQGKSWPINKLPRLDETTRSRLESLGIQTTEDLLKKGQTAAGKSAIAHHLQQKPQQINKWLIMADLARVESVGCDYCGLLLHGGIASIEQLSQMHPQKLHRQILKLQVSLFKRKDYCPPVETVQKWIQEAKQLIINN